MIFGKFLEPPEGISAGKGACKQAQKQNVNVKTYFTGGSLQLLDDLVHVLRLQCSQTFKRLCRARVLPLHPKRDAHWGFV